MTTNKILSNATIAATCNQRILALKAYVPAKTEIGIGGAIYKASDLIAIYQAVLDNQAALLKSRAQAKADLAARRDAETKREAIEFPLKGWVLNHLGADSTAASEFGFAAPKKATRSAEDVANAVKLAKATRVARGTIGKKKKLEIKGSLDTPSAPAAPATHAAPAAAVPAAPPVVTVVTGGATPAAPAAN